MWTEQERIERAEIIGSKLAELRSQVLRTLNIQFGLRKEDAEDIYSDTCCYMLDRGVDLLSDLDCGGAIRRTAKNRALNLVRNRRRLSKQSAEDFTDWGIIHDPADPHEWINEHDSDLVLEGFIRQAQSEPERIFARELRSASSIPELAKSTGINQNTAYGIFRRLKTYARQYEQG